MLISTPLGSTQCPICGSCEPHHHTPAEIDAYTRAQVATMEFSLDSDAPMAGGACNLGGDCEACQ